MLMIDCHYSLASKIFNMFRAIKFKVRKKSKSNALLTELMGLT